MDYGLKVSKADYDVLNPTAGKKSTSSQRKQALPHLLYAVATPYLKGATLQVTRYKETASKLNEENGALTASECLHEVSCLFEDLATIAKYTQLCGDEHELNNLFINIRNHIRHDLRENFDAEDVTPKRKRAELLGIKEGMQFSIGFSEDAITISGVTVTLIDILNYIVWATNTVTPIMEEARKKGYLS